jgi:hypothetical protein
MRRLKELIRILPAIIVLLIMAAMMIRNVPEEIYKALTEPNSRKSAFWLGVFVLFTTTSLALMRRDSPRLFGIMQAIFGLALLLKVIAKDTTNNPTLNALLLLGAVFVMGRGLGDALPPKPKPAEPTTKWPAYRPSKI